MKFQTLDVIERLQALVPDDCVLYLPRGDVRDFRKAILDAIAEIKRLSDDRSTHDD